MKKWTWTLIVVAIVVLLAMLTLREHFTTYTDALADVGQTAGYTNLSGGTSSISNPNDKVTKEPQCPTGASLDGSQCRKDHGAPTICPADKTLEGVFCMGPDGNGGRFGTAAGCTEGTYTAGKCITKSTPTCPSGYVFETDGPFGTYKCITTAAHEKNLKDRAKEAELASQPVEPRGSSSSTGSRCNDEISSKSWDEVSEECKRQAVGGSSGGTTGGSSLIPQPNSGGTANSSGLKKGNIWGPAYTGVGDNSGDGLGSGIRDYPTLLGPQPKESRMIEGAGISKPSIHTELAKPGALPSAGSTGSSEESKFFGASRLPASSPGAVSTSPGDQDMYPDFFGGAGSTAYTPSSGSSKTDPVPFLSDFSAFLK
jgi:hypothetical protein